MILLSVLAAAAAPAPNEMVCRTFDRPVAIGSRLTREVKVCRTREEWRNERQFSGLPAGKAS